MRHSGPTNLKSDAWSARRGATASISGSPRNGPHRSSGWSVITARFSTAISVIAPSFQSPAASMTSGLAAAFSTLRRSVEFRGYRKFGSGSDAVGRRREHPLAGRVAAMLARQRRIGAGGFAVKVEGLEFVSLRRRDGEIAVCPAVRRVFNFGEDRFAFPIDLPI